MTSAVEAPVELVELLVRDAELLVVDGGGVSRAAACGHGWSGHRSR
ncbi:hypothetical protein [Streptomyces sp. AC555_RSS877]|nr:hypothetical protein [Streptomyces sp. AC555_RSS877]